VPSATQPVAVVHDSQALRWAISIVAASLVLAAVSIGWYRHWASSAIGSRASPPSLDVRALTESGKATRAAATPDGRYVAYVDNDGGKYELRLLQVASERDVQVLSGSPQEIRSLHFSPDGNFIYFLRQLDARDPDAFGVFRIATLGGPATPLATDARMYSVTVSPDGKQIAYIAQTQSESQIVAIDADGANHHVLARRPLASGFWFMSCLRHSWRLSLSNVRQEWLPAPVVVSAVICGCY
jgi:WD40 repeat protein